MRSDTTFLHADMPRLARLSRLARIPRTVTRRRGGFTLLEMIIAITILAMTATLVIPMVTSDTAARLRAASVVVRSDIELAQVMTSADPSDPVVMVFNADGKSYALCFASDTTTPITRQNGGAYQETMGVGRLSSCTNVVFTLTDMPDNTLMFNAHGGLEDFTLSPIITLILDGNSVQLMIAPTTGTISEV
ncbi:MAG: prepilin-type N-terminal cleavage/methylation domain-containing protein [Phycisphaerales bacterium]|nr:prepilin-type N-terminal cleavage/methylation domain-containing protein [Phycisphaerales bacterium]